MQKPRSGPSNTGKAFVCHAQPSHTVIRAIFIDDTYPIIVICVLTVVFKWQYVDIFFQNDKKFILVEPNRLLH